MNPGAEKVRRFGRAAWLVMRHALALVVTVGLCCLLWTVVYFGLLLWALISDAGVGSPLSYPIWLLVIFLTVTFGCVLLILPSTLLAGWCAERAGWGRMSRIPISLLWMAMIALPFGWLASVHGTALEMFQGAALLWVSLLLPLGIYWWALEGGPMMAAGLRRLGGWVRRKA
jgi:hypothetical protein